VLLARHSSDGGTVPHLPIHIDTQPPGAMLSGTHIEASFPWMISAWLAGVAVLLARSAGAWWRVRALHQLALRAARSKWQSAGNRIAARLRIAPLVRVVELPHIDMPFVLGCVRPVVVLPIAAMSQLNVAQVEAILAHELAHVRRHDYLVNLLQTLVETLFFYHPAVWWLSERIREEREHCCDDVAVELCGDPVSYAEALTELENWRAGGMSLVPAATGGALIKRVRRILQVTPSNQTSPWTIAIVLLAGMLFAAAALAQPQEAVDENVTFEVASVRPNTSPDNKMMLGVQPGGRFNAVNVPLFALIRSAYALQEFQLVGGPDWIKTEKFDIVAKAAQDFPVPVPGGPPSPGQLMLRSLLKERFKLAVRREAREMPIYALVRARQDGKLGAELKPSTLDCEAIGAARLARGEKPEPPKPGERPVCGIRMGFGELAGGGFPLSNLASSLVQTVERTVVDKTGLSGPYDFYVKWTPDRLPPRPAGLPADQPIRMNGVAIDPNGPSIFTALQEQLGLKLEASRGPVNVLVILSVERPTPD
jgi:uncharacterized protein (TIGR03435 family)